tara:strand:- start:236 stop:337 length:102 start_codon:yes stop_codon:yes gene_type:complete
MAEDKNPNWKDLIAYIYMASVALALGIWIKSYF